MTLIDTEWYSGYAHATKGATVELVGQTLGWSEWSRSGKTEHAEGSAQMKAAEVRAKAAEAQQKAQKASNYVGAAGDEAAGYFKSLAGAVTGNRAENAAGLAQQKAAEARRKANAI